MAAVAPAPAVSAFLEAQPKRLLIGGEWRDAVSRRTFDTINPATGKYAVSAAWQSGLSNGARAGEIFGLIFAGWAADRIGYKKTTIASLGLMIAFIFVLFFAPNVKVLVIGEILCGEFSYLQACLSVFYGCTDRSFARVDIQGGFGM